MTLDAEAVEYMIVGACIILWGQYVLLLSILCALVFFTYFI